jgi:hypothetical protein
MIARKLLALAALLAVTACGVQPTGVVDAGEAPSIPNTQGNPVGSPALTALTLYFVYDGQLHGVARTQQQPVSMSAAIGELLRGPTEGEQAKGLVTLLPLTTAPVTVTLGGTVTVDVPFPVGDLPPLAVSQLVCTTIVMSQTTNGKAGINLVGSDGPAGFRQCLSP